MFSKKRSTGTLIAISIILMLVSGLGASLIQTQANKILITDALIPMPNGETLSVLVYRPKTATKENPAPVVITSHGYFNSKEMQAITSVELARRGFVVFSMDIYQHGFSSGTNETYLYNREYYGLGMSDLIVYVHDFVDYIDPERIGITGHSTGGRMVSYVLDAYGRNEKISKGITEGAHYVGEPSDAGKYNTLVSSALIVANFPAPYLLENIPENVNVGISMAYYDEGAPMQLTKQDGYFWSDLTVSPEAKNFINTTHPGTFKLEKEISYDTENGKPKITLSGATTDEKVVMGKAYGSVENRDLRIVYNPKEIHPLNHFSAASSAIMTDFFTMTLGAPNPLPGKNQVWFVKEVFNLIGMIGFFMLIVPFSYALLETPYFKNLKGAIPNKLPALETKQAKTRFALNLILASAIAGLTVMPFMQSNKLFFPTAATQNTNAWFSQPSSNQIMIWAVGNGLIALALFFINYFVFNKKIGVTPKNWGLNISLKDLLKTILLVVCVLGFAYTLLMTIDMFFKTDFRFWTIAIKAINSSKILTMLKYAPFFFIFYFANSLAVNGGNRVEGQDDCKNLWFSILANTVGPLIIIILQYVVMVARGEAIWHPNLSWINILLLIPFVPYLGLAAYFSRRLFEKTGNVFVGALLNTALFTLIMAANTTTISTIL